MDVLDVLAQARDVMTVRHVFGEPYERDGVTILPVAKIRGGAGGTGSAEQQAGSGGFGVTATPAGVYVIKAGQVRWEPAFDINRAVLGGQIVAITLFLILRPLIKAWARRRSAQAGA